MVKTKINILCETKSVCVIIIFGIIGCTFSFLSDVYVIFEEGWTCFMYTPKNSKEKKKIYMNVLNFDYLQSICLI